MKTVITILAIVGLVAATNIDKDITIYAGIDTLSRLKFLFEIVYRVEDPLQFEEHIKLGATFKYIKDDYFVNTSQSNKNHLMDDYYNAYKYGKTLPKGEFFGAMVESHYEQLHGLFEFFYYAKSWEVFQRTVCWARLHANEAMFVHALTLAFIHRDDLQGLMLPAIYEILPQYFFNSKFVNKAVKFDYDVWSKYIMYEKVYKDIMYTDYSKYFKEFENYNYFYTKDWKMWQWWKLMGLGEHWYSVDRYLLRDNIGQFNKDPHYLASLKDLKMIWMPVDYTRDIKFYNQESELSYFTEDLEWNAYWYYFNMNYHTFLDDKTYGLTKDRRGEYWVYRVGQMLARYYMERLSHGYGGIPDFSFQTEIEYGYDPQLIHYNGVGFSNRKNYECYQKEYNDDMAHAYKVNEFFRRIKDILATGYYTTAEGQTIDMGKPETVKYLGNMAQGNDDIYDKYFSSFWYLLAHMYVGVNEHENYVLPSVLLNFETSLRDPISYMIYKQIYDVFYQFRDYLKPHPREELLFPGVTVKDVKVSELVTYFDLVDFDVTNLMNDKMDFVNGKLAWNTSLFGRQMRLNHKPFTFDFSIKSDKKQKVVVRAFMGPKYDEYGRVLSLNENRKNFLEIDEFVYELKAGNNNFKRSSNDFDWTTDDRITYTESYKLVMLAYEGKYKLPLNYAKSHCGFPDRLILPRGREDGMPMQFFFYVTPFKSTHGLRDLHITYSCGIGSGVRNIDEMPFEYPFDREIDEYDFFAPNMKFKDVKVIHKNTFDEQYDPKHDKFGTFDYNYLRN